MTRMIALATYRSVADRYGLSRYGLARRLADPAWTARHGITTQTPGRYDREAAARIAAAYSAETQTPARTAPSTVGLDAGWRCLHCGGTTREPHCLSCEVSIGRGHDVRPVRLRRCVDVTYMVGRHCGTDRQYGTQHDRVDALRHEPIDDQVDVLLGLLRRNLDRRQLQIERQPKLVARLERLGWDDGLPWSAVAMLVRRVCERCGHAVAGLGHILRRDGRVKLEVLSRLRCCRNGCDEHDPPPDGWEDRLAEIRARKQAAGEMPL